MQYFVFFLSFLVGLNAFSQDQTPCKSINLLTSAWQELPPVQHEEMCYAWIASDLLSSHLEKKVSPLAVANFYERSSDDVREKFRALVYGPRYAYHRFHYFGGSIPSATRVSVDSKLCEYSFLDRDADKIATHFFELESIRESKPEMLLLALKDKFDPKQPGFAEKLYAASSQKLPLIDLAIDLSCVRLTHSLFQIHFEDMRTTSLQDNGYRIDQLLRTKHPLAIGYDFRVMRKDQTPNRERLQHASMLFGQEWNERTQACDYLIRYTDLNHCNLTTKSYPCTNGIVKIPKSDFLESLGEITYLDN